MVWNKTHIVGHFLNLVVLSFVFLLCDLEVVWLTNLPS